MDFQSFKGGFNDDFIAGGIIIRQPQHRGGEHEYFGWAQGGWGQIHPDIRWRDAFISPDFNRNIADIILIQLANVQPRAQHGAEGAVGGYAATGVFIFCGTNNGKGWL
jgi:hypothetical protein